MKHVIVLGMSAAALVAALSGCSSSNDKESGSTATSASEAGTATGTATPTETTASPTAAQPGTGHVNLNNAKLSEVTGVTCQTDAGVVTITVESTPRTIVMVTDEDTPTVNTVSIGELGAEGPSLAYVPGVGGAAPQATREGKTYTVSGTGKGAEAADPNKPVDLPFEIAATCP